MARKRALSTGLFAACIALGPPAPAGYVEEVLKDGPVGYWRLGELDLSEPVQDASGNGLDGEYVTNGGTGLEVGHPGAIAGDDDTAVRFQTTFGFGCGDCGQARVPPGGPLDLGTRASGATITLEAWFKLLPSSNVALPPSAFPRIFHYNDFDAGQYAFGIVGNDNAGFPGARTVWGAVGDGGGSGGVIKAAPTDAIPPSDEEEWHHFVATIDGETIQLYLNGEELLDLGDSDPIAWQAVQATIGGRVQDNGSSVQGFPGLIDEMAVYDFVLPPERIQEHYAVGSARPIARITAQPTIGTEPLEVAFDGSASSAPPGVALKSYQWSFGDGQSAAGAKVTHVYAKRGKYTVTLTVTADGDAVDAERVEIEVLFASGPVTPWASSDVGEFPLRGGARREGECLLVFSGGGDITGNSDECHFVYQEKPGSFTLVARVQDALWEPQGRATLMARSSLAPDSALAGVSIRKVPIGPIRASFLSRTAAGRTLNTKVNTSLTFNLPAVYLKLERSGEELIGSVSSDGQAYTEISRGTIPGAPERMLAGLAVSATDTQDAGQSATVTFCDVDFPSDVPPEKTFHRGDADDNGKLELTDAIRILGYLVLGLAEPPCLDAADSDDNGKLELTDAIRVLGYLFLGNEAPAPPGPPPSPCGADPGDAHLGCASYANC
ncbi:MAG: PKD domain-containing protein [Planctomycetes bacterium]|nr:PKD domain-containing protein [Planctomycetota bacterium]